MTIQDIASRILPVGKQVYGDTYKMLIYGEEGTGKTTLAAQAPNPIIIDADRRGSKTLAKYGERFEKIPVFVPSNFEEVLQLFWMIRRKEIPCKTVVIDTVTMLQSMQLREVTAKLYDIEKRNDPTGFKIPWQSDYRANTEAIVALVTWFVEIPDINLVLTAHSIAEGQSETLRIRPMLTPSVTSGITGLMDVVGYLQGTYQGGTRWEQQIQVNPSPSIRAKNRLMIQGLIKHPTWAKMIGQENPAS